MNRIAEILKNKGIEELVPNEDVLEELGMKLQTWNKIVGNKKDPDFEQVPLIAKFLNVEIEQLFPNVQSEGVRAKHGLLSA